MEAASERRSCRILQGCAANAARSIKSTARENPPEQPWVPRACPVCPTNTLPTASAPHFSLPSKWRDTERLLQPLRTRYTHTLPQLPASSRRTCLKSPCSSPPSPTSARPSCPAYAAGSKFPRRGPLAQPQRRRRPGSCLRLAAHLSPASAASVSARRGGRARRSRSREGGDPRLRVFTSRSGTGGGSSRWSELPRRAALGPRSTPAARAGAGPLGWSPCPARSNPSFPGNLYYRGRWAGGRSRGRARTRAQGSRGIRVRGAGPRGPGSSRLPEDLFSRDLGAARGLPGHLAGRSQLAPGWRGRVPSGAVGSPVWLRRGRQGALPWDSGATGAVHAVLRGVLAALAVLSREARRLTLICRSSLLIWFLPRFGDSSRQRRPTHLFSQTSRSPGSPEPAGILAPFADPQGAFRLAYLFCPPFEGVRSLRGTTAS